MLELFKQKIHEIYNIITSPIDNSFKLVAIGNYKKQMEINKHKTFGESYYEFIKNDKEKGTVYTPEPIAKYMIENTIKIENIIENPYLKIVDPSCGTGNILIPCFKYVRDLYKENLELINNKNELNLKYEDIEKHIICNNIYGFDIDETALKILTIDLFIEGNCVSEHNFFYRDFLLSDEENNFDVFIGNPPYVGQKSIDKAYSSILKTKYKEIYKDKGDLSYCFFKKALESLNKQGYLTFITSRYFLESPSGEELRKVLKEICSIYKIIDFYGIRPFKNVGVDPVIIFVTNSQDKYEEIEVIKPLFLKGRSKKEFYNSVFLNMGDKYKKFKINKNLLNNKGWILRNEKERSIINKIEQKSFTHLSNICNSYQGIITGCDKAFVVNNSVIKEKKLEQNLIKPWIKSSFLQKNEVSREDSYLIYSDLIDDENNYKSSIVHIESHKEKLMQRRECQKGMRKWYQLQWGRVQEVFESEKIVFPYKSSSNRFAIDKGSYFSADVYCLILKENVPFTYEYLVYLLNSKIYEFYFQTFGKKLGEDLYEYYPNNIMKLCIPVMMEHDGTEEFLYKYFGFTEEEIGIIEGNNEV